VGRISSSLRSDTPANQNRNDHDLRTKSCSHYRGLAGHRCQLVEGFREIGYAGVANSRSISKSDVAGDPAILVVDGDIALPDTAERILSAAVERFGRMDTLVNNAGVFIAKPFIDYSETDFAAMIAVNLAGFFHISQKAASWMLATTNRFSFERVENCNDA
jgi:NAD(P)-dependent dehydrogenase (short-subunit alcohol dehydrogenase family)